jgi:2-isopropylmalate synthase
VHQDGIIKNRATYEIMRPEDVGAAGTQLILTSRSGRNALIQRMAELGFPVKGDQPDRAFVEFKKIADRKKIPYVVLLGPEELQNNTVKVKDIRSAEGQEIEVKKDTLVKLIKTKLL